MKTTLRNINERIRKHGFELVKGRGYYYFAGLTDEHYVYDSSVYGVSRLDAFTVDEWEADLIRRIEGSR